MKFQVYFYSIIRVTILCTLGYFGSWLLDDCHEFIGDKWVPKETHTYSSGTGTYETGGYWEWSGRHGWACALSILLVLISIADMIIGTVRIVKKNYDTSKWT